MSVNKFRLKEKSVGLFVIGVSCSILSAVIYITDPVNMIILGSLKMSPDSIMFQLWQKPPIKFNIYLYIFNITNPEEFLNGSEKLKINEVGPYVYQEILENLNVTWNANGSISYIPKRTLVFEPKLSINNPERDYVNIPNVPMLGISSSLYNSGFFLNFPFVQLVNIMNSSPILNVTVHDYLWGYYDKIITLAGTIVPGYVNFNKFGLVDRMYDEGNNLFNLNIKGNKDMVNENGRYLSIEMMNGSPGLKNWGYVEEDANKTRTEKPTCARIQGASEGTIFPYNIDSRAVFRIYRKAFCRPLPITFVDETSKDGLPGYEYTLSEDFADWPKQNPENKCYTCYNNECLKKGLIDLTPCYYNIPMAASLPHFLDADPTLFDGIEGLNPSSEKHRSRLIVQQDFGVPLLIHARLQTNLVMRRTWYNSDITAFNNLTIPLFWFDFTLAELPSDLLFLVKLGVLWAPKAQLLLTLILALGGVAMMCWSLQIAKTLRMGRGSCHRRGYQLEPLRNVIDNSSMPNPSTTESQSLFIRIS